MRKVKEIFVFLIGIVFTMFLTSNDSYCNTTPSNSILEVTTVNTKDGVQVNFKSDNESLTHAYIKYINFSELQNNDEINWVYSDSIPLKNNSFYFDDFKIDQEYLFAVSALNINEEPNTQLSWSAPIRYKHDFSWSLQAGIYFQILALLGALGLFIFGMKRMSEGIQKVAGKTLRQLIGGMTSNRANGIFFGFVTTAMVQSSSATTVTVVSFVNNGILNLKQGIAVIFGANVGTTITAWLIAYFGFMVFMPNYALIIFLFALILLFSANDKTKNWGETLSGIALLFFGLAFFKSGIPETNQAVEQLQFLDSISGTAIWNVLLATLIGALLTIVFQSSIAMLVLTLILVARSIIPYEMALGMVLGGNIGTTITANIAAMTGNVSAKRAARAHLFFNLFGIIWMTVLFAYFIPALDYIFESVFNLNAPSQSPESRPFALATFHTGFNIINATVLYFFIDIMAKIVEKLVPSPDDDEASVQLGYIKAGMLSTPELTIIEAKKEVAKFGKIASKMSTYYQSLLTETDKKKKKYLYDKIEKYEAITDRVQIELTNYLTQTSENEMSESTSKKVRAMMSITSSLERIGDVFYQMTMTLQVKEKERIWFSPEQRQNLLKMLGLIDKAFEVMVSNLRASSENVDIERATELEEKIDAFRDELRDKHFADVEKHEYNIKSGMIYSDLFFSCEKIGDYIINISETLTYEKRIETVQED